jgi:hypothetical protein
MPKSKKNAQFEEMIEILEHATIVYTDGAQEQYDALRITEKGVMIGRISTWNAGLEEFVDYGFIPKHNIADITNASKRTIRRMKE